MRRGIDTRGRGTALEQCGKRLPPVRGTPLKSSGTRRPARCGSTTGERPSRGLIHEPESSRIRARLDGLAGVWHTGGSAAAENEFRRSASSRCQARRGLMKIAQQFTAGMQACVGQMGPVGTTEVESSNVVVLEHFSRPYGTELWSWPWNPAMNRWAIVECPYGTAMRQNRYAGEPAAHRRQGGLAHESQSTPVTRSIVRLLPVL